MKVLKPGRKQNGWTTEAVCTGKGNGGGGCGATLLVEQPDLFRTVQCCKDETEYYITFRCSECGVKTDIEAPFNPRKLPNFIEWKEKNGIQESEPSY